MRTSETTSAVFDAIVKAQALIPSVKKDKRANAGSYSYSYASLDTVIGHASGPLAENGLAVVQEAVSENGQVGVNTRIVHRSGEWIEYGPVFLPGGKDAQSYGSAITYARRYALSAALGIASDEDDDGKGASKKNSKPAKTWDDVERQASGGVKETGSDYGEGSGAPHQAPPENVAAGGGAKNLPSERSTPAAASLWDEANRAGYTATKALKRARDLGFDATAAAELTEEELRAVMAS
jgi:hypothetical protein